MKLEDIAFWARPAVISLVMISFLIGVAAGYFICWKNLEPDRIAARDAREFQETVSQMIRENTAANEKLAKIVVILEESLGPDTFFWVKPKGKNAFERILDNDGRKK